jgi:hypothetical protein
MSQRTDNNEEVFLAGVWAKHLTGKLALAGFLNKRC